MLKLSSLGEKLCETSGIVSLMDDLGDALRKNPEMIFMGGGNPAKIPESLAVFETALRDTLTDESEKDAFFGVYQSPMGDETLREDLAALFNKEYNFGISANNIALGNGSQAAFFILFNLFGGKKPDGSTQKIMLPMTPEYLGYSDQGVERDMFVSVKPQIEKLENGFFKYHVDFSAINLTDDIGALCVSRPTNPTGNVISDEELAHLDALAKEANIPLIVDGAYGVPFPSIIFTEATPSWNENIILVLSLSKLGLPGARTGIVIAREEIITAYARANTILNLSTGNMGPSILARLLKDESLLPLSREVIQPFYKARMEFAVSRIQHHCQGLPVRIHEPEGAIFLWLWFEGLPISSQALYEKLKEKGVLVMAGEYFFPGLSNSWKHTQECIRITYCQDEERIEEGSRIIGETLREIYGS